MLSTAAVRPTHLTSPSLKAEDPRLIEKLKNAHELALKEIAKKFSEAQESLKHYRSASFDHYWKILSQLNKLFPNPKDDNKVCELFGECYYYLAITKYAKDFATVTKQHSYRYFAHLSIEFKTHNLSKNADHIARTYLFLASCAEKKQQRNIMVAYLAQVMHFNHYLSKKMLFSIYDKLETLLNAERTKRNNFPILNQIINKTKSNHDNFLKGYVSYCEAKVEGADYKSDKVALALDNLASFTSSIRRNPVDPTVFYLKAKRYFRLQNYRMATLLTKQAAAKCLSDENLKVRLGKLQAELPKV